MNNGLIDPDIISAFKYFGTITLTLAIHIIGGFFVGRYLDGRFHTSPIFSAVGMLLGTLAGFVGIYRSIMHEISTEKRKKDDDSGR